MYVYTLRVQEVLRLWWNINKIIFTHSFRDSLVEIRVCVHATM
jgi:hypothetical protein